MTGHWAKTCRAKKTWLICTNKRGKEKQVVTNVVEAETINPSEANNATKLMVDDFLRMTTIGIY